MVWAWAGKCGSQLCPEPHILTPCPLSFRIGFEGWDMSLRFGGYVSDVSVGAVGGIKGF